MKDEKKGNKGQLLVSGDGGALLWSTTQNAVRSMDLAPLEEIIRARAGGRGGGDDAADASSGGSGGGGGGKDAATRDAAKAARLKKKQDSERAKLAALKAGGSGDATTDLERALLPLVKRGDELQAAGETEAAMAAYTEALRGFQHAGFKRPKLSDKIRDLQAHMAAAVAEPAPEPDGGGDTSIEVDVSIEAASPQQAGGEAGSTQ